MRHGTTNSTFETVDSQQNAQENAQAKNKKRRDAVLTDDQLLEQAIRQAQEERKALAEREEKKRQQQIERESASQKVTLQERALEFEKAADTDLPHASFMAPPEHPSFIEQNPHAESYRRILQKPAGNGERDAEGSARERAAYARKLRRWRRNGARGQMPQRPVGNNAGAPLKEDFLKSRSLQLAHCSRYGSWLVQRLKEAKVFDDGPPQWALPFRFNISSDDKLMNKRIAVNTPHMTVVLIYVSRVVYMCCVRHEDGIRGALRDGSIRLACSPDNVLEVLDGGSPPRDIRQVEGLEIVGEVGTESFPRGIPCELVLSNRPWPTAMPWPVTPQFFQE